MILRRRKLLSAIGVAGSGIVAGCIGEDDPGTEPEPTRDARGSDDGDDDVEFPTQDVRLIIPYGTGGYDTYTRLVAPYVEEYLPGDAQVRVQNIEGAGGQVATEEVFNLEPDGYSNMIVNFQAFSLLQMLEDVNYDLAEMTWYAQIAENIGALGVGENTDIHSFEEYATAMRNGELRVASESLTGGGTLIPMLLGEVGEQYDGAMSVDNNVMFDGKGESLQAILRGDAHIMAGSYSSILPYVESGDIRIILFLTMDDDSYDPEHAPDAETLQTASVPNAQEIIDMAASRRHFAGPPDVPEPVTSILREAFRGAINDEEFLAEAEEAGRPIDYADGETVAQGVQSAMAMWDENRALLEMLVE